MTSLPALIIGSMAPDFVYFFSFGVSGSFTHTLPGVPIYCVPAGLVVYVVYYLLLRQPMLEWMPVIISSRVSTPSRWPLQSVRNVAIVLGSLAVGATTHVFWDSFTHDNTMIVNGDSALRTLVPVGSYQIPIFKILQQASSLVGFLVIATYVAFWIRQTEPAAVHRTFSTGRRLLTLAAVFAAGASGGVAGLLLRQGTSVERGLFNFVVTGMAVAAVAIVVLCIGWHINLRRCEKNPHRRLGR